jgi:glycosyltransferase involved in cell wall biosynthesis
MNAAVNTSPAPVPRVLLAALRLTDGPTRRRSGNYWHVVHLVGALAQERGVDLTVLTDEDSHDAISSMLPAERIVRLLVGGDVLRRDLATLAAVRRLRPDVFHKPTGALPTVPLRCGTIAGIADLNFATLPTRLDKRIYKELTHRWTSRMADHIVCVSDYTKRRVISYLGTPDDRVSVIHHGTNELTGPDDGVARRVCRESGSYWLAFAHHAHKNVETLLHVAERRRQRGAEPLRLCVIGEGEYVAGTLQPMAVRLGVQATFVGRVSPGSLRELYRQSRGLLFSSRYEGFGLPVLEAMANDCPVICSDICSLPEIAGDAAILVPPQNVDAWCNAIGALEQRRVELIARGRARVQQFTWVKAAAETVTLYQKVSTRASARGRDADAGYEAAAAGRSREASRESTS